MKDEDKTKPELISELKHLRLRVDEIAKMKGESKQSGKRLDQTREFYENILNSMDDLVIVKDMLHRWVFLNDAACKFWGFTREELIGKSDYDIFPKEEADVYWEKDNKVFETNEVDLNEESQTIGAERHFLSTKKSLYRDIRTGNKYVVAIGRDITERKSVEEGLKNSEAVLARAEQIAHLGSWEMDVATGELFWSQEIYRMFGADQEEMSPTYELVLRFIHPGDKEAVVRSHNKALAGKTPHSIKHRIVRSDGEIRTVHERAIVIFDETGKPVRMVGTVQDITEQEVIQETLRESEEKYRTLFDNAADAIVISDEEGNFLEVNRVACERFGYSKEEFTHMTLADINTSEYIDSIPEKIKQIKEKGQAFFETQAVRRDGTTFPTEVSSVKFSYRGKPAILSVSRDITPRKQLESQLLQSQKMEAIGQLAGGVAHDFNNLLTAIMGYSGMLKLKADLDKKHMNYLDEIIRSSERASSLTSQLLAFSRKQVLQPKIINANTLVANIEKMLCRLIGEDVDLSTVLDPELGVIKADPGQIEQVIMNLAVNARDAMLKGGKLTIETCNIYQDKEYCKAHTAASPGWYVMLTISDTGHGMDEETKKHIFEPFFTTKAKGQGTGLGLATVYGIVKQSGGYIWVYSEPDRGTTFKVYFPRVDIVENDKENSSEATKPLKGNETILIAEDEEVVRNLIFESLVIFGYDVIKANNGREAIEVFKKNSDGSIHMLITDVIMPDMGGRELVENLEKQKTNLKVLYISGYTDNAIVHHGELDKGVAFLQKPFSPHVLAKKVREVLDAV